MDLAAIILRSNLDWSIAQRGIHLNLLTYPRQPLFQELGANPPVTPNNTLDYPNYMCQRKLVRHRTLRRSKDMLICGLVVGGGGGNY